MSSRSSAAAATATAPSAPKWVRPQAREATTWLPPATIHAPKIQWRSSPRLNPASNPPPSSTSSSPIAQLPFASRSKQQVLADKTIHFDDTETSLSVLHDLGYGK